jgi:hypothetical protein
MRADGVLVRIRPDGTEEAVSVEPPARMTPDEIEAAASNDAEVRPFTLEELAKARRVPRTTRGVRRTLEARSG